MFAYGVFLLFVLQLLTAFVAANYAFGLLNNRLPPESASAVLLLSPFLLTLGHRWSERGIRSLVVVVLVARLTYPLFEDTLATMLVSGAGVSASFLLLPLVLGEQRGQPPWLLAGGLALAVSASIGLRAIGSGVDASTTGLTQFIAWPAALLVLGRWPSPLTANPPEESTRQTMRVVVCCIGMIAAFALLYFAFSAPNVIARWTGTGYRTVLSLTLAGLLGWSFLLQSSGFRNCLTPGRLRAGTAVFGVVLVGTVLTNQVDFPSGAEAYPIAVAATPAWSTLALSITCLLSPILIVDFYVMARQLQALRPSTTQLGLGFGLGAVFLLIVTVAQILTTTYDYVPVVGPLFRDKFWAVTAAPAVCLVAALFWLTSQNVRIEGSNGAFATGVATLAFLAVAGAILVSADPDAPSPRTTLTVATFNVEQGYDLDNRRNFEGQLALLRRLDADIIGLQESDTNRVAGGNDDLVRYFADNLDLNSYFGPKTVAGSFGIALLSRYPIEEPQTFYLFSRGEQTAVISAKVTVSGKTFNVLVTHLGNGGPLLQQEEVLSLASSLPNVVLVGDFNFRPDSPQYRLTTSLLEEAWAKRWPLGRDGAGEAWARRIDYVFVSPGADVRDAGYIDNRASDHPALVVELAW